jgi:hypothetical protein
MSNLGLQYQRRKWRYFFIDGKLHKLITINRGRDEALAWNYVDRKKVIYSWSGIKRKGQPGYTLKQASQILNRTPTRLRAYWTELDLIKKPQMTYSITTGNPGIIILSEDDIREFHQIISNMHYGRPRLDGVVTLWNVADEREINAFVKHDIVLYAKNKDGEVVPVYAAEDW